MSSEPTESSGVQELIDRLHHQGVEKGHEQADQLVAAARKQAMEILDSANRQADEIVSEARDEASRTKNSGEEALRLASRDAILSLTEDLREDFIRKLRHLVGYQLKDQEFLKQMILEIVRGGITGTDPQQEILLLNDRLDPNMTDRVDDDRIDQFVRSLGGEALRSGLSFSVGEGDSLGVRVQVVNDDLEVDLTIETLTALLLKHLSPRFRDIIHLE